MPETAQNGTQAQPDVTDAAKRLEESARALETSNKQVAELKTKVETLEQRFATGSFAIMTDGAGKLDPENPEHVQKHFLVPRLLSAMYFERVETRGDKCWSLVPGKNGAAFERDVAKLMGDQRAAARAGLESSVLRAIEEQRSGLPMEGVGASYRNQTTDIGSQGGYLVPSQLGWYQDVLRNTLVVGALGVHNIQATGIPFYWTKKTTAGDGAYLTSETGTIGPTSLAFGEVRLLPRVWGAYVKVSRRALRTAAPELSTLVRDDLMMASALNRQKQLLKGTGLVGAPVGILNAGSGVTSTTMASTSMVTLAAAISTVDNQNGLTNPDRAAWVVHPKFRALVATLNPSVGGSMVSFVANASQGWLRGALNVHGFPMYATAQFVGTDNSAEGIFGDWSQCAMIDWGQELIFSEHVNWTTQQVSIGILDEHEVAIKRAESFTYFNDGDSL